MSATWQEFVVLGVTLHGRHDDPTLLLRSTTDESIVALSVGAAEAAAVVLEIEGAVSPVPLTHHLLPELFVRHGFRALRVEVLLNGDNQPAAELHYHAFGADHQLPLRPSDGVSIALRCGLPIYLHAALLPGRILDLETVARVSNDLLLVDRRTPEWSRRSAN